MSILLRKINNTIVQLVSCLIIDKKTRKTFRNTYKKQLTTDLRKNYIKVSGFNNKIIVIKNGKEKTLSSYDRIEGLNIKINGSNNVIKLIYPINFINSNIEISGTNDGYVEINESERLDGLNVVLSSGTNQKFVMEKDCTCCGLKITLPAHASVFIGEDCMFAQFIEVWGGDCHMIRDKNTGKILNGEDRPVKIGKHCWIGDCSKILKNTNLPDNTIVGAGSIVTKSFKEKYTCIAGNPAKLIRNNVVWNRENHYTYNLKK